MKKPATAQVHTPADPDAAFLALSRILGAHNLPNVAEAIRELVRAELGARGRR